jgi:hypothetical protein
MNLKPTFPKITSTDVQKSLDGVASTIASATTVGPDGKKQVDVSKLEADAKATGEPVIEDAVAALVNRFSTTVAEEVDGACGRTTVQRKVKPKVLDESKLKQLAQALSDAVDRASDHLGSDQKLSKEEAGAAHTLDNDGSLAGTFARVAIEGSVEPYKEALEKWRMTLAQTAYKVDARKELSAHIDSTAAWHAAGILGQEAIRWAFRAAVTHPDPLERKSLFDLGKGLEGAERSWLAALPLFGISNRAKTAKGHLDDEELRKHFKAEDLTQLINKKKDEVESRVGHWDDYIAGKDLPDHAELKDPDFHYTRSSC